MRFTTHKKTAWSAVIIGVVLSALILFLIFFDWNMLRSLVAREITAKTGRPASIKGDLKVHLFSWTPSAEIDGLALKNPPWAARELMFGAKQISLSVNLGRLLRGQIVIPQLKLVEPVLNLERDAGGRASWELGSKAGKASGNKQPAKIPTIQGLLIQDGKLQVTDQIRKLRFGGSVVAVQRAGEGNASAFKVRAKGSLNEKAFRLDANGGALLDLTPDKPYEFSMHVTAADINLDTRITVLKPFDLSSLDVKFVVNGDDLADVFYLTGLALPNTPPYRLSALLRVAGTTYRVDDLSGKLGSSDLGGKIVVETSGAKPKLTATLTSRNLKMVDLASTLGGQAGQPESLSAPKGTVPKQRAAADKTRDMLLPDADLQVNRVRGMDADVTYSAASVNMPKFPMKNVNFHLLLNDGVISLDPLSFILDRGSFSGNVRIDARPKVPESAIDMRMADVDLAQFKVAKLTEPPLSGKLAGRIKLHGTGSSLHKFAAGADGAVSLIVPGGEVNQALAELTGINVTRGLGLLLTNNDAKTAIRCGVIDFQAQKGILGAKTVFVDTTDVLITGSGDINLNTEALNLSLRGKPKKLRFTRIRSPIIVKGTLEHPSLGVDVGKLAEQGAVATALGTLLTPFAAVIAFVDPGLAKNKDCAASLVGPFR